MTALVMIDAHAHIYGARRVGSSIDALFRNFRLAANQLEHTGPYTGVAFLASTPRFDPFESISRVFSPALEGAEAIIQAVAGYRVESIPGPARILKITRSSSEHLYLFEGTQVVTVEGIEVLVIGRPLDAGQDCRLEPLLAQAGNRRLLILPWGAGKWLGKRADQICHLLKQVDPHHVFIGDNGGRPAIWRGDRVFRAAQNHGIGNLPGTDVLPIPGDEKRSGNFGFFLTGSINEAMPWESLRQLISESKPRCFGRSLSVADFLVSQISLRIRSRRTL